MHIDMPTQSDIQQLAAAREDLCISIYLPTALVHTEAEQTKLSAKNLFDTAVKQIEDVKDRRTSLEIKEALDELLDDSEFWTYTGRSLAIFLTPTSIVEYRLPNHLNEQVSIADRFAITPLLRAVTFPQAALVLAISQNQARLVEISADEPAQTIEVPGLPASAEASVGPIGGRAPAGRIQGDEGRKVRLTQYARAVDHALRPLLNGASLPLILAATEPLLSIYRNLSGYQGLATENIRGNSDDISDTELAQSAREILDRIYQQELSDLHDTFQARQNSGRAVTDLSELARHASFGAIATLVVDFEATVEGSVDDSGALHLGSSALNVIEEITRRAIATGAQVLAVRSSDLPEGVQAAGILRFAN